MAEISDESDFYGDEDYVNELRTRADSANLSDYWQRHSRDINVIARSGRDDVEIKDPSWPAPTVPERGLHNCYEGQESARQLHESPTDFLSRLPVRGSAWVGPWLWCANVYANSEDQPETQRAEFMQLAPRLLSAFMEKKRQTQEENPNAAAGTITRKLKPERDTLKAEILALAGQYGMKCGKWMLFPAEEDASAIWERIVEAVINDRLGVAAKIATDGATRLICIYTKNFADIQDVERVLRAMARLNLLPDPGTNRHIYYKCDAYTYLGIDSSNEYGLQASLYSSKEILEGTPLAGTPKQTKGSLGNKQGKLPFVNTAKKRVSKRY